MREIVYVAGETSGDRHGAALHRALVESIPSDAGGLQAKALGGKLMRAAGIDLIADSSHWGAIGVVESLKGAPIYVNAMLRLQRDLLRHPPSALILIDFGYFNVRLARWGQGQKNWSYHLLHATRIVEASDCRYSSSSHQRVRRALRPDYYALRMVPNESRRSGRKRLLGRTSPPRYRRAGT